MPPGSAVWWAVTMSDTNFTPDPDAAFVDPEDVVDELDSDPEVPAHHGEEPEEEEEPPKEERF